MAEHVGQFAKRGQEVDDAEPRHGAAHEVVGQKLAERGPCLDEVVAVPERRPRDQDQQQSRFEQERDEQQTSEQETYPLACALDRLSMRLATSR